jgi:DnaJ-domain-containing protein 1
MGIEEDMFNAFKYAGFSGVPNKNIDPMQLLKLLMSNLEVMMLTQMGARITARIVELQGQQGPTEDEMDPFTILGVNVRSTREEVDKAYREKARAVHPDMPGGSDFEMAKVNAAYNVIKQFKGWK